MFKGVDVTVVLFINLLLVDVGLEVVVVLEVFVSGLVMVKGVVVLWRWVIFLWSITSFVVVEAVVFGVEVVLGNFCPNLSFSVVSFGDEGVEFLIVDSVVLELVEVFEDVLVTVVGAVVFVFWPKGINFGVIGLRVVCFVFASATFSLMDAVEDSTVRVVFVLAPKGIATEFAMASGGLIFYKDK